MTPTKEIAAPNSVPELERRLRSLIDETREVRKALRLARSLELADKARANRNADPRPPSAG